MAFKEYKNGMVFNDDEVNTLQDLIKTYIDTNINKLKGTVLYEDEVGTNESITFNESIKEGELVEIIYCRRRVAGTSVFKSTGKIPYTSELEVALDMNYYSTDSNQQDVAKIVVVNSDGIIVTGENTITNSGDATATSTIYITKVIKYEEE